MIAPSALTRVSVSVKAPTDLLDDLPDYAPMLAAYHRTHAAEPRAMVAELPLHAGD